MHFRALGAFLVNRVIFLLMAPSIAIVNFGATAPASVSPRRHQNSPLLLPSNPLILSISFFQLASNLPANSTLTFISSPSLHSHLLPTHLSSYSPPHAKSSLPLNHLLSPATSLSTFSTIFLNLPSLSTYAKHSNSTLRRIVDDVMNVIRYDSSSTSVKLVKNGQIHPSSSWRTLLKEDLVDGTDVLLGAGAGAGAGPPGPRSIAIVVGGGGERARATT